MNAKIKNKILKAISKGASKSQLIKHVSNWDVYTKTTREERLQAKALHDTVIANIFES